MNVTYLAVIAGCIGVGCGDASTGTTGAPSATADGDRSDTGDEVASTAIEQLVWTAEPGFVLEDASNPGAATSADGSVYLSYQDRDQPQGSTVRSVQLNGGADWLAPGADFDVDMAFFHAVKLPSGLYRKYGPEPTIGGGPGDFTSKSSTDGVTFSLDVDDQGAPIIRYELQPEDNGTLGTFDTFVNADGHVVLLYVGDREAGGRNNIRRAVSTDGGDRFEFDRIDVFGDAEAGGGGRTYVDQDTLTLPDGRVYVIAMKSGELYHFVGDPQGDVFTPLSEGAPFLSAEDFEPEPGKTVASLHDPQIVQLADGRLRIYVAAIIAGETGPNGTEKHYMVAATSHAL